MGFGIRGVIVKTLATSRPFRRAPLSCPASLGAPRQTQGVAARVRASPFWTLSGGPCWQPPSRTHRILRPAFPNAGVATLRFEHPPSSSVWQDVAAASERTGRCSGANGAPTLLAREETRPSSRVGLLRWPTESGATARLSPLATLPHTALRAHWARPVHPDATPLVVHVAGICAERSEL